MKNFIYPILVVLFLTAACKKDVIPVNSGIYRGVFLYIDAVAEDTLNEGVCNLAIFEDNLTFNLQGDTSTGVPKSSYGSYLLHNANSLDEDSITFYNNAPIGEFFYDQNLFLDTTYIYTFNDTVFTLFFETPEKIYQYRLERK